MFKQIQIAQRNLYNACVTWWTCMGSGDGVSFGEEIWQLMGVLQDFWRYRKWLSMVRNIDSTFEKKNNKQNDMSSKAVSKLHKKVSMWDQVFRES